MNVKAKLLILDLDGTVVPMVKDFKGLPSARMVKTIIDAKKRGEHISIATGRPLMVALPLIEKLEMLDPCIVADGAVIYDPQKHVCLEKRLLSEAKIHEVAQKLSGYLKYFYVQNMTGEYPYLDTNVFEDITGIIIKGVPNEDCDKVHDIINSIEDVEAKRITKTWSGSLFVISNAQATKQVAVHHLMEYFKVKPEEIIAVGDSENDIPMILAAGIGIAMGNASDGLKSIADEVCPSVEDDGVAFVIEKYFPNK